MQTYWTSAGLMIRTVWQDFFLGQATILAVVISLDLLAPVGRRGRGMLTGIAIGIKLTPEIFVSLLLVVGHRRAARNAVVAFAGTVIVAMLVVPSVSWQ